MTEPDRISQLHDALEQLVDVRDGELLAGWIIVYETVAVGDRDPVVGQHHGPAGMTEWRALGLLEWIRPVLLDSDRGPDDDADDE